MIGKGVAVLAFGLLRIHLHLHLHHRFHGPPFDYAGLAAGVFASWAGLPGPGEPLLFAAGVLAADHKLDLMSVLALSFAAAVAGGSVGWAVGSVGGRRVLTAPGPLHGLRLKLLARGDEVFRRYVAVAVFLAPSFLAGIYGVRTAVYLWWNAFWALAWTLGIGLGAYYAGPPILEVVVDLGWIGAVGLVALVLAGVALELRRRRARRPPRAAHGG